MLKRKVEQFFLNIFTFNSKFGPFKSWGHQFYVKIPTFFGITHMKMRTVTFCFSWQHPCISMLDPRIVGYSFSCRPTTLNGLTLRSAPLRGGGGH